MDEQANNGSAQAGNPAEANGAAASNGSSGAPSTDLWAGLHDEGNRRTVEAKGWATKGLDDVVTSYRELEGKLGKAIVPPGDDAKPEDWQAFYGKLGRPEKAEAYEFKLPEGLPENFPYDGKSAEKFKVWAHEAGLPPRQAQKLHDEYVRDYAAQIAAHQEAEVQKATAAHNELVKAWGDPKTETYQRNTELANRTIRQQGGSELLKELKDVGALGPNGEVKTPRLAMALAKIGETLYAEDTMYGGVDAGPNPFSPKSEDLTKQGQILRSDPERAKVLIRQAGIDPAEYGL